MSDILSHSYFIIPMVAICVFIFSYLMYDRILAYLYEKSLGNRETILDLLDKMFIKTNKKNITLMLLLFSFGMGGVIFLALWPHIIMGFLMGVSVTMLGWSLPKILITRMWNKRCTHITNQMVDGMTIMSNGVKAGLSVTQAMERVVENMRGPLPQEFGLILNKIRLGMSVEEALNDFGERVPRQDTQMLVTAVNILKETGGNLAETFTMMTTTIRDRQKVEKKIEAMTAQGVMQGVIMTLVPFLLLVVFLVIDPNYVKPLFTTPMGWVALSMMLGLQIIGGVMIKKVVTIKV